MLATRSDSLGGDDVRRVVRVFISSTFLDMQAERDVLVRRTFPALRARLRTRGVELIELDLRWGITEEQAESGQILPICLQEIDRCRPYFIGILGDRYGWVPPLEAISPRILELFPSLQGEHGRSVTELEIIHGALKQEDTSRALFFVRNAERVDPDPRLLALKRRISNSGAPVQTFKSADELGALVERLLTQMIEAEFPDAPPANPYAAAARLHDAYAGERRLRHFGADRYLASLDRWVEIPDAPPVLIAGASGAGKSALVANWIEAYRRRRPQDQVFAHYLGASPESADPELLLRRLWVFLNLATGEDILPAALDPDLAALNAELPARFSRASAAMDKRGARLILALDGLDKLTEASDLRWLPDSLPPNVRLLVSALEGPARSAAETRGWLCLEVQPMQPPERAGFVEATLRAWGRDLSPGRIDRILANPLSSNPLFLRTVLEELRYSATEARLDERLEFYLQARDVPDLFTRVLDRLEADCGADFTRDAMSLIWASRSGLEEAELLRATQAVPIVWSVLRNNLNDAVREQDGRITFSHDFLRNAVELRYLSMPELKRSAHLAIADLFGAREPDERQAEEQLYQLRMAADWTQLERVLLDMERLPFTVTRGPVEQSGYWRALESRGRDPEALLLDAYDAYAQPPLSERMLVVGALLNNFLWEYGSRSPRSEQHARRIAADVAAAMGEEHNASIDTAAHLALLLRARDDLAGAREAEQRILDIRLRVLGEQHDETLSAMNNLALTLETMGDLAGAQELQEKVLAVRLETLGEAHVRTAQSMNNLALTVRARGDYGRARDLHAKAHAIFRRLKGADDPESLRAASNLVRSLSAARQEAAARDLAEATFATVSVVLGPEHPDTLTVMSNLAMCRQEAGDLRGALELSERCLELTSARSGPQHSDTLTCMSNLATVLDELDEYGRAMELLEKVVERNIVHLGADHPDSLVSKGNLAMICSHAGDYSRALRLLSEVGETSTRTLGGDHPSTLTAIANLASLYVVGKDFDFARSLQEHVVTAYLRLLGSDHPDTLQAMHNLAGTLFEQGDLEEALSLAQAVLVARERVLSAEHPVTWGSMADVAALLAEKGDVVEAGRMLQRLLIIQEAVSGSDSPAANETRQALRQFQ